MKDAHRGKFKITIAGENPFRIFNLALFCGARLYDVKTEKDSEVSAYISPADYLRLKRKKAFASVKLKSKGIFAYFLKKGLIISLAIFLIAACAMIFLGKLYILDIRISGIKSISQYELRELLKENGAYRFALKSSIDTQKAEEEIKEKFPAADIVNVYFKGSDLVVFIIEGSPKPEIKSNEPCDIIASEDGIIEEADVVSGESQIKRHMQVKKGDVLVKGNYIKNETSYSVHSQAKIIAAVDYTQILSEKNENELKIKTGRETLLKYLKIGKTYVKIDGENDFKSFTYNIERVRVVGENQPLFFKLFHIKCEETRKAEDPSGTVLASRLKEKAFYMIKNKLPKDAEIKKITSDVYLKEDDTLVAAVTLTVLQDIGKVSAANPLPEDKNIGEQRENIG